jgi:hypothetical protein
MLTYCEAIPHRGLLVLRMRFDDGSDDEYDARDPMTGRYVSGYGSLRAACAALGVEA